MLWVLTFLFHLAPLKAVAWQRESDLAAFLDDQPFTCTTIPFNDVHLQSVPVFVTTQAFTQLQLRLWVQNLSAELVTGCDLPLLVLSQASKMKLGQGSCEPFCGILTRCELVSKRDVNTALTVVAIDYLCHCQVRRCRGVTVHVPRSAVLDPRNAVGLCHVDANLL